MGHNGPAPVEQLPLRNINNTPMDFLSLGTQQQQLANPVIPGRMPSSHVGTAEATFGSANVGYGDPQSTAMDLSPDVPNLDHQGSLGTPDQPTPSTSSNKGSSHTSFTPPSLEDGSKSRHASAPISSDTTAHSFFQNPGSYTQPDANFSFPGNWDYTAEGSASNPAGMKEHMSTGMTPGATGLTPIAMPDGTWQMNGLEGNEWMFSNWSGASPQP